MFATWQNSCRTLLVVSGEASFLVGLESAPLDVVAGVRCCMMCRLECTALDVAFCTLLALEVNSVPNSSYWYLFL